MAHSTPLAELSLKSLKAMQMVAETGNVTHAAAKLNRSQTTVSKAIHGLEHKIGKPLFERKPGGMALTPAGQRLHQGIQEALQQFRYAATQYARQTGNKVATDTHPVFDLSVSYSRLYALLLVQATPGINAAAQQSGVSRASLYDSIHFLEQLLDVPLFSRTASGNVPTAFCEILTRHTQLAFKILQNALDEIVNAQHKISGKVAIVAFPAVRNYLLPAVCVQLKREYPDIEILLKDGLYRDVESQLRSGEIDFLIGTFYQLHHSLPNDLQQELLFEAPLQMLVRAGHPLFTQQAITVDNLSKYSWILPPSASPARRIQEQLLSEIGITTPHCQIEAYSYSMQSEILRQSNSIGLAFVHQCQQDEQVGSLRVLPIPLRSSIPLGMTRRRHTTLSPPARVLREELLRMTQQIQ